MENKQEIMNQYMAGEIDIDQFVDAIGYKSSSLGKSIGRVSHTFSTKGDSGWKEQATITIDFSLCSDSDIKTWLVGNRTIPGQKVWRAMDVNEFIKNVHGTTFQATSIGQKVRTNAEKLAAYVALGIPEDLAQLAIDEPVRFHQIMASVNNQDDNEVAHDDK